MHSQKRMSSKIIQIHFNNNFKIVEGKGHDLLKGSYGVFKAEGNLPI